MFTTLVESRRTRRRSTRGAITSILTHTLLIAGALALTHPTRGEARSESRPEQRVVYVPAPRQQALPNPLPAARTSIATPALQEVSIPVPTIVPTSLPPIDFQNPPLSPERIVIGGPGIAAPQIGGTANALPPGTVLDAGVVDRVPRVIGNAQPPRYPDILRASGATGQVVVRFVVDTLGRAELGELTVVETTHPLFASAVKSALASYRFTPGEAAGRKVRTLVQIPFSFTLR